MKNEVSYNMQKTHLTCYETCKEENKQCKNKSCSYWVDHDLNCVINLSKNNKTTFEEIGKIFDLTRMRICQIEKKALQKIKSTFSKNYESFSH